MRRGSIIGPFILILIGVLFLLNNIRPELSLVDMLAMWWPYLLILWGILRLAEIGVGLLRAKPVPERGISGGEWVLVVFLCIAGSGLFAFKHRFPFMNTSHFPMVDIMGEPYDYPIAEQARPAAGVKRVLIENFRGNARIVGADVSDIKVNGRKTVRALQPSAAEEGDRLTPLDVVNQGDMLVIRTNQDRAQGGQRTVSADLDITVPKGTSIECHGRQGDFDINDLNGNIEVISDNAGVRVQNIQGSLRVDLRKSDIIRATNVKGQVELRGKGNNVELENIDGQVIINAVYYGDLQFRNISQPIRYEGEQTQFHLEKCPGEIRMARGYFNGNKLIGPIQITARSKDVQISDFTQALEVRVDRGDIELRPAAVAKIDVRTRSGDIELAVPASAKFELRAEAQHGEVTNDYGSPFQVASEGHGGSITGSFGTGPAVVLGTDRGSVTVRKYTGEAGVIAPKGGDGMPEGEAPEVPPPPKPPKVVVKTDPGKIQVETN